MRINEGLGKDPNSELKDQIEKLTAENRTASYCEIYWALELC